MIGKRGKSFRNGGNGLGLSDAIEKVESWNGQLNIISEDGKGTTVTISLGADEVPSWYQNKIDFNSISDLILVDDRPLNHSLVQDIVKKAESVFSKYYFTTPEEFEKNYQESLSNLKTPLFLIDYDLGASVDGIDLIEKYNLSDKAFLFTNYYDDPHVQLRAMSFNIRMFPKFLMRSD